jgi:hypothetical protein
MPHSLPCQVERIIDQIIKLEYTVIGCNLEPHFARWYSTMKKPIQGYQYVLVDLSKNHSQISEFIGFTVVTEHTTLSIIRYYYLH